MFKRNNTMQFSSHLLVFVSLLVHSLTDASEILNWTRLASNCGASEKALTFLDLSKGCINRAKVSYPDCISSNQIEENLSLRQPPSCAQELLLLTKVEDELNCKQKETSLGFLEVAMKAISEVKKSYPNCPIPECPKYDDIERPIDCSDILRSGKTESGVYAIWPRSRLFANKSLAVYCDMETDGGGWTVIQRRGRFSTPADYFYKDWESYKNGFGNITEEFWLGNDNIHVITSQAFINNPYKVRFDMEDVSGASKYAEYSTFWIDDEANGYTLHIEGFKGTAGDSIERRHNKMKFSTKDINNGPWLHNCAEQHQGAWWYKYEANIQNCADSNLNGLYQPGTYSLQACAWYYPYEWYGVSGVEIKLRK